MGLILDQFGNQFNTGLIEPDGPPLVGVPYASATTVFTDDEVRQLLADPGRTPKSNIFSDTAWIVKGDQKQHNSCGGWGGANAFSKTRWLLGIRDGLVLSGSYLYSWANGNQDEGAQLKNILAVLTNHGTVPMDICGPDSIYRKQTQQFDTLALAHLGLGLFHISSQAELNTALVRDQLVVVCIQVDKNPSKYCSFRGNGMVPQFKGNGNHCIHVDDMRWNSTQFEYRQCGNWGLSWGAAGYGWCNWNTFAQPINIHTFYAIAAVNDVAA